VLAVYRERSADSAELHKRCITGALVASVELLDRVPPEILTDVDFEFSSDQEDDTPVTQRTGTTQDLEPFTINDLDDSKSEK